MATVEEQKTCQARLKKAQDLKKEKLQEFVSREGKKFDHHTHQMQRKSKLKKLNALNEELIEDVEEDCELRLVLPAPNGVFGERETLLSADAVSCQLPEEAGGALLFSGVDFVLSPRHRLGIIGKNGCGKTCLLNVLIGDMLPTSGEVKRHLGARMTLLQQHHYKGEQLDPDLNAIDHIRLLPQDEGSAVGVQNIGSRQEDTAYRGYLANCGIMGTTALVPVKHLSGGQRMRVALAVAMYSRPDVLILDEPTNHLDAESVTALGEALEKFEGAIIVMSHDEAFVNKLLTGTISGVGSRDPSVSALQGELWVLERQQFRRFEGNFRQYKRKVLQAIKKELKY